MTASGDLTIGSVQDLKGKLIEALNQADLVTLHFQEIKAVDLAIIQLLCATQRAAVSQTKRLAVDMGKGAFGDCVVSAGLTNCDDGGPGCGRARWFKERGSE